MDSGFQVAMQKNKYKICIWMNIPSHYQSAFFSALEARDDISLKVIYLNGVSDVRADEGWRNTHDYQPFECNAGGMDPAESVGELLPDWTERIHLICGYFASNLIELFCREHVAWYHWSEMPGIRLAELLGYRMPLFRLLNPLMLSFKRGEGDRVRKHALGAFGQGMLARKAFRQMGIPGSRIADLYYAPAALEPLEPSGLMKRFASGRSVFLHVGALCRRKGIDVLLEAFSRLKTREWCLVLCGHDKENGKYEEQAQRLGIADRVLFLGAWPSDRIAEVYAAADVFVLPSRFDGWGAVLNEAASMGLPVIGTDLCGASWHVVRPGCNGFRVRAGSISSLLGAMKSYAGNSGLLKEHGKASAGIYMAELSPAVNADRLVHALGKLESL